MQNAPKPIIKPVLLAQTVAGSPGPVGGFRSEVFFPMLQDAIRRLESQDVRVQDSDNG
jgi:hypothetical protein